MPLCIQFNHTGHELKSAEIACVAVHPAYRKSNRGRQILDYLEDKAQSHGHSAIIYFNHPHRTLVLEQGFAPASVDDLPDARQALYNYQRNSIVCKKQL